MCRPLEALLAQALQLRRSLGISSALDQDAAPAFLRAPVAARLLGQDGPVTQGQAAVNALVDAAKLVGPGQGKNAPPARLGLSRLARGPVQNRLAEEQLGVIRIERQPLGAN